MGVDEDGNFFEPSLKAIADAFITAIAMCGRVHRSTARCMFYSSVLIVNVLPISGNASFGAKNTKGEHSDIYKTVFAATREPVKELMSRLVKECPNAKGIFAVGLGHDYCHELIEDLPIQILNNRVCHPSKIKRGDCRVVEQRDWTLEVLKAVHRVSTVALSIDDNVNQNRIAYVTPHYCKQHEAIEARKLVEEAAKQQAREKKAQDAEKSAELTSLVNRIEQNIGNTEAKTVIKLQRKRKGKAVCDHQSCHDKVDA